jgi:metal-responsive CopG/Arc/MetJ family transcriptional regulator
MERVMLTLPADLLQAVDTAARRLGQKRSQLVRQLLQDWLKQQQQQEFEALLAEGYRAMAQEAAAIASESLLLQTAVAGRDLALGLVTDYTRQLAG